MTKPRLLDLFCGAGGAAMGYHRAGFDVVGVDIEPQPRYPFEFVQGEALEYCTVYGKEFDAIHASPPCQRYSTMTKRWNKQMSHQDLVSATRSVIEETRKIYIIENVVGAPLANPITLCGSMFGIAVRRHRLFESNVFLMSLKCRHETQGSIIGVYGHAGGSSRRDGLKFSGTDAWRDAMGIDWMTGKELAQAIPPAYTEWIGKQLIEILLKVYNDKK